MSAIPKTYLPEEVYLAQERKAAQKSEYYKGEVFAMSGASKEHNKITASIIVEIGQHLKGKGCAILPSDIRVYNPANTLYTYPDVVVACGEDKYQDDEFDTLLNPTIIVEVLSESTKDYDRGTKFHLYRSIPSLAHYLLVNSMEVGADLFTREGEQWILTTASKPDDKLFLSAIQYHFALKDFYSQVPDMLQ
jgi:Uma2 family endonuclease